MKNKYSTLFFAIRLSILLCFVTSASMYLLSYVIERSFEKYSIEQTVIELNAVIESVEKELLIHKPTKSKNNIEQNISLILAAHHRLFVYVIDKNEHLVFKTRGPNLLQAKQQIDIEQMIANNNTVIWHNNSYPYQNYPYRVAAAIIKTPNGEEFTIIAASGLGLQAQYIQRLHDGLSILVLISCLFAFVGTISTVYLAQKPIDRLSKKIKSITSRHLNYRIPVSLAPAKFMGIIEEFNNMLARIEDVFQRQRNFTADIAHEMRTPITNLVTQSQIALNSARTTEEYREILYSNLEEYERLSKMISDMLFLAQTDNKQMIPELVDLDLAKEITTIFEYFEPLGEEKNIELKLEGKAPIIQGDPLMLGRVISNLLSNAIRYTPENKNITITLSQPNKKYVKITIANPGQKIDAEHLPKLFDRFYRPDKSRQRNGEGAGIGLAIVKSIVETHQGTIRAESDDVSTRFIINLPIKLNKYED